MVNKKSHPALKNNQSAPRGGGKNKKRKTSNIIERTKILFNKKKKKKKKNLFLKEKSIFGRETYIFFFKWLIEEATPT